MRKPDTGGISGRQDRGSGSGINAAFTAGIRAGRSVTGCDRALPGTGWKPMGSSDPLCRFRAGRHGLSMHRNRVLGRTGESRSGSARARSLQDGKTPPGPWQTPDHEPCLAGRFRVSGHEPPRPRQPWREPGRIARLDWPCECSWRSRTAQVRMATQPPAAAATPDTAAAANTHHAAEDATFLVSSA